MQRLGDAMAKIVLKCKVRQGQCKVKHWLCMQRIERYWHRKEEEKQMDDKDFKSVVVWFTAFMAVTAISGEISGKIGLLVWTLGTALLLMWAYYEYRAEQAAERERKKVRMLTKKIKEAYTEEKENYFSQY
jgi:hypothetical protein